METGFTGNDLVLNDYENADCRMWSILIATAKEHGPSTFWPQSIHILLDRANRQQIDIALEIESAMTKENTTVTMLGLHATALIDLSGQYVIVLSEYASNLLFDLGQADLNRLQRVLKLARSIVCVTKAVEEAW